MYGVTLYLGCFYYNESVTTASSTLSLHDALPISARRAREQPQRTELHPAVPGIPLGPRGVKFGPLRLRSEEHTSELQSLTNLVCRLLLERKKTEQASVAETVRDAAQTTTLSTVVW